MFNEGVLLAATLLAVGLISLPAVGAWHRRAVNREMSEVAQCLAQYAQDLRREARFVALDATLLNRARRLATPELVSFVYAVELGEPPPELLAAAAQRLSLRLKRRVAFERKMLARTAAGRRRGAVAAAAPVGLILALFASHISVPPAVLVVLSVLETAGCWLLWRAARVEI